MNVVMPPAILSVARLNGLSPKVTISSKPEEGGHSALVEQLESSWSGFESLTSDRKLALSQVASIIVGDRRNTRLEHTLGMDTVVPEAADIADESADRHAYVATVTLDMIRKMKAARGVVASTQFAWLKSRDIAFWRLINGFGRNNHFANCVGAFAHYDAERALKRKMHLPDFFHLIQRHPSLAVPW
jgi:hypothetical protein